MLRPSGIISQLCHADLKPFSAFITYKYIKILLINIFYYQLSNCLDSNDITTIGIKFDLQFLYTENLWFLGVKEKKIRLCGLYELKLLWKIIGTEVELEYRRLKVNRSR